MTHDIKAGRSPPQSIADNYADLHPRYTPLEKLPDSAIKQMGAKVSAAAQDFLPGAIHECGVAAERFTAICPRGIHDLAR